MQVNRTDLRELICELEQFISRLKIAINKSQQTLKILELVKQIALIVHLSGTAVLVFTLPFYASFDFLWIESLLFVASFSALGLTALKFKKDDQEMKEKWLLGVRANLVEKHTQLNKYLFKFENHEFLSSEELQSISTTTKQLEFTRVQLKELGIAQNFFRNETAAHKFKSNLKPKPGINILQIISKENWKGVELPSQLVPKLVP